MILLKVKKTFQTLVDVLRILKHSKKTSPLALNEGYDIYILGNGPSVNIALNKNENFFLDKKVFCVNHIAKADFYEKLRPRYYVLCCPNFFVEDISAENRKFLDDMVEKTTWELLLFLPAQSKKTKLFDKLKENPKISITYFNANSFEGFQQIKHTVWKKNLAAPILINVLIAALFLSINMGYKKIYLLGAENSWFKSYESSSDNLLYMVDGHCYDAKNSKKTAIYLDGEAKIPVKMHEVMYTMFLCFREYHAVQNYAKYLGVDILNITPESFVDAFTKIDLFKFMNLKKDTMKS